MLELASDHSEETGHDIKTCKKRQEQRNKHLRSSIHLSFSNTHQVFIKFDYILSPQTSLFNINHKIKDINKILRIILN